MKKHVPEKRIVIYILIIIIILITLVIFNYKKLVFNSYENKVFEINNIDSNVANNNEILKYIEASQYRRSFTENELEQYNKSKINEYIHSIYNTLLNISLIDTMKYTQNATVIPNTKEGDIYCVEVSIDNKKCLTIVYTKNFEQLYIILNIEEQKNINKEISELNIDYIKEVLKDYIEITDNIDFENVQKYENEYILIDSKNNLKVVYNCKWKIITTIQHGFNNIAIN